MDNVGFPYARGVRLNINFHRPVLRMLTTVEQKQTWVDMMGTASGAVLGVIGFVAVIMRVLEGVWFYLGDVGAYAEEKLTDCLHMTGRPPDFLDAMTSDWFKNRLANLEEFSFQRAREVCVRSLYIYKDIPCLFVVP